MGLVPIKSQKQAVTFSGDSLLFFGENLSYYKAFFDIIRGRKVTDKTIKKVLLLLLFICNSLIINDYLFLKFVAFSFFDLFIFRTLVSL